MAWSDPRDWTTGEVVTATLLNAHLRDQLTYIGGADGRGTSLPVSPVDGQEYVYEADAALGIVWRLKYRSSAATAPSSRTGGTTNSSAVITMADTSSLVVGMGVTGTNVPANSYIVSIVASTSITINQNCTGTASNTMTFVTWPWEWAGGSEVEALSSSDYTGSANLALQTGYPTYTLPLSGDYLVTWGQDQEVTTGAGSFHIAGGALYLDGVSRRTLRASGFPVNAGTIPQSTAGTIGSSLHVKGAAASAIVAVASGIVAGSAVSYTYRNRHMLIRPIRVRA